MFTTFKGGDVAGTPVTIDKAPRPKRAQVRRACDACRLARAKCDLTRPCKNCKQSGRECVSQGVNEFKGLASATREVERLRQRIKELESRQQPASQLLNSPPESEAQETRYGSPYPNRPWKWQGTEIDGLQYGPISLQFFTQRMSRYLNLDVGTPQPPTAVLSAQNVDLRGCSLNRQQQDYFMDLFWIAYHINFPVVDEQDFGALYGSLWDMDGVTRQPDPLVDIVLALNIQYAFSHMGQDDPTSGFESNEMAVAGSPFYHRCQDSLDHLMESPSLVTAQCLFFSAVYLSFARCYNASQTTLKRACHIVSTLAIDDSDAKKKNLFMQLRRCMRTLDIRLSIKLGRSTPDRIMPIDDTTTNSSDWAIYYKQLLRLSETTEDIYKNFMNNANSLFNENNSEAIYNDPAIRNEAARIMRQEMKKLHDWATQVPSTLKSARLSGEPFSTHRTPIEFKDGDPQWLQRQRLVLECQYHDFCISLLRIFYVFSPTPQRGTYDADSLCILSVNHAVVLTGIISQAMAETDILKGCYQAFDWQQNALYALAGFAVACPVCPPTVSARKSLVTAREVFNRFGQGNTAAVRMSSLCVELDARIASIMSRFKGAAGLSLTPSSGRSTGKPSPMADSIEGRNPDIGILSESTIANPSPDFMGPLWNNWDGSQLWPDVQNQAGWAPWFQSS